MPVLTCPVNFTKIADQTKKLIGCVLVVIRTFHNSVIHLYSLFDIIIQVIQKVNVIVALIII